MKPKINGIFYFYFWFLLLLFDSELLMQAPFVTCKVFTCRNQCEKQNVSKNKIKTFLYTAGKQAGIWVCASMLLLVCCWLLFCWRHATGVVIVIHVMLNTFNRLFCFGSVFFSCFSQCLGCFLASVSVFFLFGGLSHNQLQNNKRLVVAYTLHSVCCSDIYVLKLFNWITIKYRPIN